MVSYDGRSLTHSRVTSGPISASTSASNAARRPGSTRQSTTASAVAGTTLALYPALSIVGFAVSCSTAFNMRAIGPSLSIVPARSGESRSKASPVSSPTTAKNWATVSVQTSGNWWRPRRATASQTAVTAFWSCTIEPCPARPRAVSRIHWMPFSAVSIRYRRRSPPSCRGTVSEKPPTSPIASVMPSNRSGLLSTSQCDPYLPPCSSSATNANTRSRGGTIAA
ncbi:Uncharacterised protein [Mycobacterium tuberculosis]|uniref:Uncharacterized protein n=2 Tax=Mycobacterium tuberculosis TaxID=1773 RepID=A0A654U4D2_MYCTX|nr:Uncharacterised protein [Mycobacterium tuberculosis]CKV37821.1 Uncharacterised protein [Mycobacterium tuberculosis]